MPARKALILTLAAAILCGAPGAQASSGDVIRDCSEDGALDRSYSQGDLSGALDRLPSDLDEYTDCRAVIRAAQLAGAGGRGSDRGILGLVDTSSPPTLQEQRKLHGAASSGGAAVQIGGKVVKPGAGGAPLLKAGLGIDLPRLLLIALLGLGAATLLGSLLALRRQWPEAWAAVGTRASTPLRRMTGGLRRGVSRLRR